jgi:hypothetical protein
VRFGQIQEKGDTGLQDKLELLVGASFIKSAGVFTGHKPAWEDPVTVGMGTVRFG